ncbi:hypothetical protein MAR_035079, partial [Mya arenaria]
GKGKQNVPREMKAARNEAGNTAAPGKMDQKNQDKTETRVTGRKKEGKVTKKAVNTPNKGGRQKRGVLSKKNDWKQLDDYKAPPSNDLESSLQGRKRKLFNRPGSQEMNDLMEEMDLDSMFPQGMLEKCPSKSTRSSVALYSNHDTLLIIDTLKDQKKQREQEEIYSQLADINKRVHQ